MTSNKQQVYPLEDFSVVVGGTAHDLRNLLTGAQLQAGLAMRKLATDNPALAHVTKILEAMEQMTVYINHLLLQTKGNQVRGNVDLNALIEKCINISSLIVGENICVKLNLLSDLPYIQADKIQVQQLILNLVLNASESLHLSGQNIVITTGCGGTLKSEPETGWWVTGEKYCLDRTVFLEIRDTGSGISNEMLHRVFDPYYSTKDDNRGLGLPLVLEIVRSHQGGLMVSSQIGQGTVFKVFFPIGNSENGSMPAKPAVLHGWVS